MSSCYFIACEYELPILYSPKLHKTNGSEINVFQCADDLNDLEIMPISKDWIHSGFYDIPYYTDLPNVYSINFRYTEERVQRLYDYLRTNCKSYKKCELWSIWLAKWSTKEAFHNDIARELENLTTTSLPLIHLTVDVLIDVLCSADTPKKLTIY